MLDIELEHAIERIKSAEKNGFITFYNKTFHYIYVRSKYLFPNIIECREFIKTVYLYIFMHIADLASSDSLEKWLSKNILICYHKVLAQNGIDAFSEIKETPSVSKPVLQSGSVPEICMSKETCGRILAKQIKKLPVLPRILFVSFYHDGLSEEEIAASFHCPYTTILWELEQANKFLMNAYLNAGKDDSQILYPFNLQLVYYALELQDQKLLSTREFALLVWESIASELTFRKIPRKKIFTLPLFCGLSALILAFIVITMYSGGYFRHSGESSGSVSQNQEDSLIENTEKDSLSLKKEDDLTPSSTTTIKEADGTVTTYDENGSEIPTPAQVLD